MHINIKSEKHILKYHRIFDILTKNIEERYNNHTLEHYFNTKYNPFIEVLTAAITLPAPTQIQI